MPFTCLVVSALLVFVDFFTKQLALAYIEPVNEMVIIKGFLRLTYIENKGAAFGILADNRWVFLTLSIAICIAIIVFLFKFKQHTVFSYLAAIFLLSGGIGNLIDRLWLGYVIDFINIEFFKYVFNFADICVTVGGVFLFIAAIKYWRRKGEANV